MPKARLECGHLREIGVARVQRRYYCPKCRARKATVEVIR
jgi:rubredoxin